MMINKHHNLQPYRDDLQIIDENCKPPIRTPTITDPEDILRLPSGSQRKIQSKFLPGTRN